MSEYVIEITDHQTLPLVEQTFLKRAICRVLVEEKIERATISLVLVNDAEIHRINQQFLGHDFPTDVISFSLNDPKTTSSDASKNSTRIQVASGTKLSAFSRIDGELIVSAETAIREATAHGWSPAAELLLYVVHGLLHLCGYDDMTDESRPLMRSRERELLAIWGYCPTGLEP